MMKKILGFVVFLALGFGLFIQPHAIEAASTYTGIVETDSLNVRAKASSSSAKLGSINKGIKVTVYEKNKNGWATIKFNNSKGYVVAKYLKYGTVTSELQQVKSYANKGTTINSQKIKLGDNPQKVIKNYGETSGWGMREYYVLEYKGFSAAYFGIADGSGEYPLFNKNTKIYRISSELKKANKFNDIAKVFGNKYARSYDHIGEILSISYNIGKYTIYFEATEYVGEDYELASLKNLTFKSYSVVDL